MSEEKEKNVSKEEKTPQEENREVLEANEKKDKSGRAGFSLNPFLKWILICAVAMIILVPLTRCGVNKEVERRVSTQISEESLLPDLGVGALSANPTVEPTVEEAVEETTEADQSKTEALLEEIIALLQNQAAGQPTEQPAEPTAVPEEENRDSQPTTMTEAQAALAAIFALEGDAFDEAINDLFACEGDYDWERLPVEEPYNEDAAVRIVSKDADNPVSCYLPAGWTHTIHLANDKIFFTVGDGYSDLTDRVELIAITSRAESVPGFYDEGMCVIWSGESYFAAQERYTLHEDKYIVENCPAPDLTGADPSLGEETSRISNLHGLGVIRQGGDNDHWSAGVEDLIFNTHPGYWYHIVFDDGNQILTPGQEGLTYKNVSTVDIYGEDFGTPCEILNDAGPEGIETNLVCPTD